MCVCECIRVSLCQWVCVRVSEGDIDFWYLKHTKQPGLRYCVSSNAFNSEGLSQHTTDSDSVLVPLLYWRAGWGKYSAAVSFYFCELCIQAALRKASFILLAHANSLANISNISVLCWHYAYFSSDMHFNNLYTPFLCFGGWKYAARSSVCDWCTMFSRARLII